MTFMLSGSCDMKSSHHRIITRITNEFILTKESKYGELIKGYGILEDFIYNDVKPAGLDNFDLFNNHFLFKRGHRTHSGLFNTTNLFVYSHVTSACRHWLLNRHEYLRREFVYVSYMAKVYIDVLPILMIYIFKRCQHSISRHRSQQRHNVIKRNCCFELLL